MWIVLLDRSGSMGDPFSEVASGFAGRVDTSDQVTKLNAARGKLAKRLKSMSSDELLLFAFNTQAERIFRGSTQDLPAITAAFASITPGGGTDLAQALDDVRAEVELEKGYRHLRLLVITDGLSEVEPARLAAERLARLGALIDAILIDPTTAGEELARAILVAGEVEGVVPVHSAAGLESEIDQIAEVQERMKGRAEEVERAVESCATAVLASVKADEKVAFTAGCPQVVEADEWNPLDVYVHLPELQEEATRRVLKRAALERREIAVTQAASVGITRNALLTFTPQLGGALFNPPSQEILWIEELQEILFRACLPASMEIEPRVGWIDVHVRTTSVPLLVARIPITMRIRRPGESADMTSLKVASARPFERIFTSYSSTDSRLVEACVEAYEALGIYVYLDKQSLRSSTGLEWLPLLKGQIEKSDLMQLYWSKAAAASRYVEEEWRHALTLQKSFKGPGFILPVSWGTDGPKLPTELAHLQCKHLDAALWRGAAAGPTVATPSDARASTRISAPILPLLPGSSPAERRELMSDVREVAALIEEVTGLRYSPVPTLLVDDVIIRRVRLHTVKDLDPDPADARRRAGDEGQALPPVVDALGGIAMEVFHLDLRSIRLGDLERAEVARIFRGSLSPAQSEKIAYYTEGGLHRALEDALVALIPDYLPHRLSQLTLDPGESKESFVSRLVSALVAALSNAHGRILNPPVVAVAVAEILAMLIREAGLSVERAYSEDSRRLVGSAAQYRQLAERLGKETLATSAPKLAGMLSARSSDGLASATLSAFGVVCASVLPTPQSFVGQFLAEVAAPMWRRLRDELADVGTPGVQPSQQCLDFLEVLLRLLAMNFERGAGVLGELPVTSDWVVKQACALGHGGGPLKVSGLAALFRAASERLIQHLRRSHAAPHQVRTPLQAYFARDVAAHGVFLSRNSGDMDRWLESWAVGHQLRSELALPDTDRVLYCVGSAERFEQGLREKSAGATAVLVRGFQRSVLVHEHFHAALETGRDLDGASPRGPSFPEAWNKASNLNESLAAWMELHLARGDADLTSLVWSYIDSGTYPDWPYAGARVLEAQYQSQGLRAIQEHVNALRADPETAQAVFDTRR
jgi:hypothetical protein